MDLALLPADLVGQGACLADGRIDLGGLGENLVQGVDTIPEVAHKAFQEDHREGIHEDQEDQEDREDREDRNGFAGNCKDIEAAAGIVMADPADLEGQNDVAVGFAAALEVATIPHEQE